MERHLHATAAGRLLLAEQPEWRDLLPPSRLTRFTPATVTRPDQLDACLAGVRAAGFATQSGELHRGTSCLAVPVRSVEGELVAGVVASSGAGLSEMTGGIERCARSLARLLA
ncbi:IclR family transcriptional regulator domain-containing protein [Modestobacter sp. SYSU DS0875]